MSTVTEAGAKFVEPIEAIAQPAAPEAESLQRLLTVEDHREVAPLTERIVTDETLDTESLVPVEENSFGENWWQIQGDDDEVEEAGSSKAKREPIGMKHYAILTATAVYIMVLSSIFKEEPMVATALSGAVMDGVKTVYAPIKDSKQKNIMRIIAAVTLVASIALFYSPKDNLGITATFSAIPFSDFGMAVFAKCDLNKLKEDKAITKFLSKKWGIEPPKKVVKAVCLAAKAIIAGGLVAPVFPLFIRGTAAVLMKAQMRRGIDMIWQRFTKIKDKSTLRMTLAAAYSTAAVVLGASLFAMQSGKVSGAGLTLAAMILGIVSLDVLMRTAKQSVKAAADAGQNDAEEIQQLTLKQKCMKVGMTILKSIGLLGTIGGISYLAGDQMVTPNTTVEERTTTYNPGWIVALCQEAVALMKVGSKRILPLNTVLGLSMAAIGIGSVLYLARDYLSIDRDATPGYGAALFFTVCFINLSLFISKNYMRPAKIGKPVEEPKVIELEEIPQAAS